MGKIIDITNQRFGYLTALYPTRRNGRMAWHCRCDCGNEIDVDSGNLRNGKTSSCGCKRNELISKKVKKNLIGQRFGKLTVIEETEKRACGSIVWKCKCDCGNICEVPSRNLITGHTKSCGCLNYAHKNIKDLTGQQFGKLTVLKFLRVENNESIWQCQCECGNICEAIGWHLTTGIKASCGCLKSKGEAKIISLLQENNIPFIKEKIFDTCIFPDTNRYARFDFYVDNKYIIEYDGLQHFVSKNSGWSCDEQLKHTQEHDAFKNQWCKEHNIPIIRIPYNLLNNLTIDDIILKNEGENN